MDLKGLLDSCRLLDREVPHGEGRAGERDAELDLCHVAGE